MTETITQRQTQHVNAGLPAASRPDFVPPTPWPELEAARAAHERALEEHSGVEGRRREAAVEERQLQAHLKSVQEAKRNAEAEATAAVKRSAIDALRVVAEHGPAWLEQIEAERAAALQECDELRAALQAAEARAHQHDGVEAWLQQALSEGAPQPFGQVAENVEARKALREAS